MHWPRYRGQSDCFPTGKAFLMIAFLSHTLCSWHGTAATAAAVNGVRAFALLDCNGRRRQLPFSILSLSLSHALLYVMRARPAHAFAYQSTFFTLFELPSLSRLASHTLCFLDTHSLPKFFLYKLRRSVPLP